MFSSSPNSLLAVESPAWHSPSNWSTPSSVATYDFVEIIQPHTSHFTLSRADVYVLLSILLIILSLSSLISTRRRYVPANEPLQISSKIPFVGHIFGLLQDPVGYPIALMKRPDVAGQPIFTLPLGPQKMHIVASPELAQAALRHRNLTFDPWVRTFCKTVLRCSARTVELMTPRHHTAMESYNRDLYRAIHQNLADSNSLHEMNTRALSSVASHFNTMERNTVNLYSWSADFLTEAMSVALYGSDNPLAHDSHLRAQFWDFEEGVADLFIKPLPSITVPRAYAARKALSSAFEEYFTSGKAAFASPMIKARLAVDVAHGVPVSDSKGLVGVAILNAALSNTHALLYWLLVHIFHDSELVSQLREELEQLVTFSPGAEGEPAKAVLDTSRLANEAPLFRAVYAETTRLVCVGTSIREVVEDTKLSHSQGDFFLHQGSVVQIPASVSHRSSQAWGEEADNFSPARFLSASQSPGESVKRTATEKLRKQAFHPFGGGKHLCPGRFLTMALLQGIVATLILGFDVVDSNTEGELEVPKGEADFTAAVLKPSKADRAAQHALVARRAGKWQNLQWEHQVGHGKHFLDI